MAGSPIRVLIADDEAVLRAALTDLVESDDSFELGHLAPETRVIAHSAVDDRATVVRMLEGGASATW